MPVDTTPTIYTAGADLEHGWGPTTPLVDTIHRRSVLALAESTARPSQAMGARTIRTDDVIATHLGRPAGYWNAAVIVRPLDSHGWDRALRAISDLESNASTGESGAVDLWSPFPTPDLAPEGWVLAGHPVAMWRPPTTTPSPPDSGLRIERVVDADGIAEWGRAAVECYPLDADPGTIATPGLLDAPDIHLLIGRDAGRPVAVAATVITNDANAVAFVAIHADARGQGHGKAITWAATSVEPDLPAVLLASDDGRPLYEHLGYLPHTRWTMWIRPHR